MGFEEPVEMYPDSPVEKQPDLWLVRRIEPETDVRIESKLYLISILFLIVKLLPVVYDYGMDRAK